MRDLGSHSRRLGIVAAVAVALTLAIATSASAAPLLFTGNYSAETVSVLDTATDAPVVPPIEIGGEVSAIAIAPGGQAFVVSDNANTVTAIDTRTLQPVATIPVGEDPEYVAVAPDGKSVYVADASGAELTIIDPATDTVAGSIPLNADPYGVAFSPDGRFAYVTVGDTLEVIETATREVVGAPIPLEGGGITIAVTPDGTTAYVTAGGDEDAVLVVNLALRAEVGALSLAAGSNAWGVAVTPDGSRVYVTSEAAEGTVSVFSTATGAQIGEPIKVGGNPYEIALTPNGETAYVADYGSDDVTPIDTTTNQALAPIPFGGSTKGVWQVAVTPDQSPTASFTPPDATATVPTIFSGATSTDPDGTVAAWNWSFGDGGTATGISPSHTYAAPGTYTAQVSVIDNEGCGEAVVFTGRTAYCGGNPLAKASHAVEARAPVICTTQFRIGRVVHNRRNGTVRLQVKLPAAGSISLVGPKVHAVTRKAKRAGSTMLTVHARVQLNKRLKKKHHASVRVRLKFTPGAGCGSKTTQRSIALLRAPRRKHHHH